MSLIRRSPYREMLTMREAMNRLFEESMVPSGELSIAVDMHETDEDVVVEADLPGLKPEDVELSVHENTLHIKGEFETKEEEERGDVHFQERRYGSFRRAIGLPSPINPDEAEAEFEDGVLTITLPKVEERKSKQIEVQSK